MNASNGEGQAVVHPPNSCVAANRAPPRTSYAATTATHHQWCTVPSRKGKGKQAAPPLNSQTMTKPTQPPPNKGSKPQHQPKPTPRPEMLRTEITVQQPLGSVVTSLSDASLICRQVAAALHSAKSEIPLLSGRWATHTHNYVYTFAGNVPFTKITQIAHILLQPFPNRVLTPCAGWSQVIFHRTPVSNPDCNAMYTNEQLLEEVVCNPICAKLHFILAPTWVR